MISGGNGGTMSRAEAEEYRLELMDERTVFVEASDSNYFGQEFDMWYVLRCIFCPRLLKLRTLVNTDICFMEGFSPAI